ncbi:hypothetical protein BH23CHL8_BH23CHL8_16580 [soil metagenome]
MRDYDRGLWKDQVSVWARPVAITMDAPDCVFREDPSAGAETWPTWLPGSRAIRSRPRRPPPTL